MSFLKSIVKTAGKGIGGAVHITASVALAPGNLASKTLGKIPVLGAPLKAVINISQAPMRLADSISKGNRLDRAVIANIKSQIKDVKTVGPYAQMVLSVVPGVGTVAAGAIGAGIALASGQPIDKILVAGVRGSLPGGAIATTIFDASQAALSGKPLAEIGIAALPLDPSAKAAIKTSFALARDVANGKNVATSTLAAAEKNLPKEVRTAMTVGIAIAQGKAIQLKMLKGVAPAGLAKLAEQGAAVIATDPIAQAGLKLAKTVDSKKGFSVASSLLRHAVTPMEVVAIRTKLNDEQRAGFDLAAAGRVGAASGETTKLVDPTAKFAFAATVGVKDATNSMKGEVIASTLMNANAKAGTLAAASLVSGGAKKGFWYHVLMHLGLEAKI